MRLPWRRRPVPVPAERPDYTAIALLEHEIYGITPEPGTAAAAVLGLRRIASAATPACDYAPDGFIRALGQAQSQQVALHAALSRCTTHEPVDTSRLGHLPTAMCRRCGTEIPDTTPDEESQPN